jgi:DNA polymerase-3 subunit delta'
MNHNAANALLKTLEEPAPGVRFLLISHRPGRLAATIRSRCSEIKISLPDRALALQWLEAQKLADPSIALDEAAGAPLLAQNQHGDADYVKAVQALERVMKDRGESTSMETLLDVSPERLIGMLQKRALDKLAYSLCGRGLYRAIPSDSGQSEKVSALQLARWCQTLVAEARFAAHPLNQRLLYERILNSVPGHADN